MVIVDDATYVKMKDTLYWGDAWKASKAKAQIESSYTDEQYNKFVNQLWGVKQQPTAPSNTLVSSPANTQTTTPSETTPEVKQETEVKQQETAGSTVPEIQQQGELKPLSQDYYNQTWDDAQSKIISNLNNYRQTNPEYFRDYESFKKNFSYDARNDEQKQTLDSWYWGYQKWMELAWVPVTDLYTQYKDWQVSMNELENLRVYDPAKYAELQNQINKWNIIAAYDDKDVSDTDLWNNIKGTFLQSMMTNLTNAGSAGSEIFDSYKNKMESPEMLALWDQTTEIQEEIDNLNSDIDSLKKQVEAEYEWTWASRSKINAIIADRTYDLQLQLRTKMSEYNKVATQYNNRMNQYQNEFNMELQEYQLNMQERNQRMNELGFAMDLMSFQTPEEKQEMEWNYRVRQQEYKDWNINSSDPTVQLKAIQNSVDELLGNYAGIPTQRSSVQIAQDIQTAIKNGSSLGAELTTLNKQMQSKPEYKLMYNATYSGKQSLWTINWQSAVISYDANGNYTGYKLLNTEPDSVENTTRSGQIKSFKDVWAVSSDWNSYVANLDNAIKLWSWGWQCGAWANDILVWAWGSKVFGNSLDEKLSVCDTRLYSSADVSKVKEWTFAVLDLNHKSSDWINHGHVWLVTHVDLENNLVTVLDSNGQAWNECWGESTYRLDSVLGTYTPNIWVNANYQGWEVNSEWNFVMNTNTNLSSTESAYKEWILSAVRSGNYTPSGYEWWMKTASEQWWIDELNEAAQKWFKVYLNDNQTKSKNTADSAFRANEVVKEFEWAINQIEQLQTSLNDTSWVWDMSAIFTFMKTLDPSSVVRESEFNSAAATAWVVNPESIYQRIIKKNWDGTFLTEQQREDFKKIAKEFVKTKAKNYQIKYDELKRMYSNAWIDEQWLPTNMADMILNQRWWATNQSTNSSSNTNNGTKTSNSWYSSINSSNTQNNNTWYNSNWVNENAVASVVAKYGIRK